MPTLEFTVLATLDGQPWFEPLVFRLAVNDVQAYDQAKQTGGGFVALGTLPTVQALVVRTLDEMVTVRLDAQSDAGIELEAGGFMLVMNGTVNAGAATNLKVQNASGDTTQLQAWLGGSGS